MAVGISPIPNSVEMCCGHAVHECKRLCRIQEVEERSIQWLDDWSSVGMLGGGGGCRVGRRTGGREGAWRKVQVTGAVIPKGLV